MRLIAAIALLPFLAAPAFAADQGIIAVTGHGEVTAAPDTAYVTSGVTSQAATAREALDANTAAMAQLLETLKAAGIEARDIQTSGFSVNPNYVYTDAKDANGYTLPPKISGYQVANTVSVRVRDLSILGSVLDQSVTVGANSINGISFSVDDPAKLYEDARKAAFTDARAKAELYAGAAGEELAQIQQINEQQGFSQPPVPMMFKAMSADVAAAPVPVATGELTFAIDVNVTWALEP